MSLSRSRLVTARSMASVVICFARGPAAPIFSTSSQGSTTISTPSFSFTPSGTSPSTRKTSPWVATTAPSGRVPAISIPGAKSGLKPGNCLAALSFRSAYLSAAAASRSETRPSTEAGFFLRCCRICCISHSPGLTLLGFGGIIPSAMALCARSSGGNPFLPPRAMKSPKLSLRVIPNSPRYCVPILPDFCTHLVNDIGCSEEALFGFFFAGVSGLDIDPVCVSWSICASPSVGSDSIASRTDLFARSTSPPSLAIRALRSASWILFLRARLPVP